MVTPLHLGLEHPSVLWLLGAGLLAFVAGVVVNLYRSRRADTSANAVGEQK